MSIPDHVREALAALEIELPEDRLDRLAAYLDLLLETNQRMNLTAVRDRDAAWQRLIVDSLTLLPGLEGVPEGATLLDVGTGGGLPGVPVAIALPGIKVTLLETTGKKCDFLRSCVELLPLPNVTVVQGRAEDLGHDPSHRQRYDYVVSRAVGPMPVVLELSVPFAKVGASVLAMKGPKVREELDGSGDALALLSAGEVEVFAAYPESFENDLVIVHVVKDAGTAKTYPRQAGIPKRQPL